MCLYSLWLSAHISGICLPEIWQRLQNFVSPVFNLRFVYPVLYFTCMTKNCKKIKTEHETGYIAIDMARRQSSLESIVADNWRLNSNRKYNFENRRCKSIPSFESARWINSNRINLNRFSHDWGIVSAWITTAVIYRATKSMYRYALQLRIPGIYLSIYCWLLTAVDKLSTHVGFWVHVKIASRIVSHITTLWHIVSFGCCTTNHSLVSNSVESCDIRKWVASGAIPRANTSKQQWRVSVGNFSRCFFKSVW